MAVNYTAFIAKVRLRSPENSPPPVPYRDFATRQHLINDSPYSYRYAIILHLIEETTRGGGHKHKHRKEGRKHSRRINHRYRSVTRQRASERGGFQGSRRIWRKKRKQKFERRKEKEGRSLSLSLSLSLYAPSYSTQFSIHFIGDRGTTDEREVAGFGVEWQERKHTGAPSADHRGVKYPGSALGRRRRMRKKAGFIIYPFHLR